MGKKRKASAEGKTITCSGFKLALRNDSEIGKFQLRVVDGQSNEYRLFADVQDPKGTLVGKVMRKLASSWPDYEIQFQVDSDGNIVAVV